MTGSVWPKMTTSFCLKHNLDRMERYTKIKKMKSILREWKCSESSSIGCFGAFWEGGGCRLGRCSSGGCYLRWLNIPPSPHGRQCPPSQMGRKCLLTASLIQTPIYQQAHICIVTYAWHADRQTHTHTHTHTLAPHGLWAPHSGPQWQDDIHMQMLSHVHLHVPSHISSDVIFYHMTCAMMKYAIIFCVKIGVGLTTIGDGNAVSVLSAEWLQTLWNIHLTHTGTALFNVPKDVLRLRFCNVPRDVL